MERMFCDRQDAGQRLAEAISLPEDADVVVFGLARGGVVVAEPVASALGAPLEVLVLRKIGHPRQRELGLGAMAPDGRVFMDENLVRRFGVSDEELLPIIDAERAELERRSGLYQSSKASVSVRGKTAVVVDDGLATGVTAVAAGKYLRELGAAKLLLAVPVGSWGSCERMREVYDEVVCLSQPDNFRAVGQAYERFGEVSDEEVRALVASK